MNGSLFLSPDNPNDHCAVEAPLAALTTLGIIAEEFSNEQSCLTFMAGDNFSRHIVFAGCSPYLNFEPKSEDDFNFCHIAIHGVFENPQVLTGRNTVKPRCPKCRGRIKDWQAYVNQPYVCPECETRSTPNQLDWRQHAAVGRLLVEVRNVFPGEASPSDRLMAELNKSSQLRWRYAWAGMKLD